MARKNKLLKPDGVADQKNTRLSVTLTNDQYVNYFKRIEAMQEGSKISVTDVVLAALSLDDKTLKTLLNKIVEAKVSERRKSKTGRLSLAKRIENLPDATRKQIEDLINSQSK